MAKPTQPQPPPLLLLLLAAAAPLAARATLVLSDTPPRSYNTFDAYPDPQNLNASFLLDLIGRLADSPLSAAGYTAIFGWAGWSTSVNESSGEQIQHLDGYGRQVPAPERFPPGSMQAAAAAANARGLVFGLWQMRGVHQDAVARRLPVKGMEQYTLDMLVDTEPVGGGKNGSCLWNSPWLGVNASHPAAQAYYDSVVEGLVELGVGFIEADCFMCAPCYTDEMLMMSSAVKRRPEELVLYFSPGGGNEPADGAWAAANQIGTMYRTLTDFHGEWYDCEFVAAPRLGRRQRARDSNPRFAPRPCLPPSPPCPLLRRGWPAAGGLYCRQLYCPGPSRPEQDLARPRHDPNGPGVVGRRRAAGAARPRADDRNAVDHRPLPPVERGRAAARRRLARLPDKPEGARAECAHRGCANHGQLRRQLHLHGRLRLVHHPTWRGRPPGRALRGHVGGGRRRARRMDSARSH
jgi:hypothetical protein